MYEIIQMEKRITKNELLEILEGWNRFLKRRVHMIACGGTAMTLLGVKESTKDVDFMIPDTKEHQYLTKKLEELDYKQVTGSGWQREGEPFRFDLFFGNSIHTTTLLESPLEKGRNILLIEYSRLYIGILNEYDLIVSKLMRGTGADYEDCLALAEARIEKIDIDRLVEHFNEMIAYDISQERLKPNIGYFIERLREKGLHD